MSNVNETRLYQFLTEYGRTWMEDADENNDGQIIKSEFINFLDENFEWDGTGKTAQNDMINKFWKKFDTNTSNAYIGSSNIREKNALSAEELDRLSERLEDYEVFNTWVDDNLSWNSGLVKYAKRWKQDSLDKIAAEFEKFLRGNENPSEEDIIAFLEEDAEMIQKEEFVDYYSLETLESLKGIYSSALGGYDISADDDLLHLIKEAVDALFEEETQGGWIVVNGKHMQAPTIPHVLQDYEDTIRLTIANYLDSAKEGEKAADETGLNNLQIATFKQAFKDQFAADKERFAAYADEFNTAFDNYLNNILWDKANDSSITFNKLMGDMTNIVNDFKASKTYATLDNLLNIFEQLGNIPENHALLTYLTDTTVNPNALTTNFKDVLLQDEKYLEIYKEILKKVAEEHTFDDNDSACNGENNKAILAAIVEEITKRLTDFMPGGFSDELIEFNVDPKKTGLDDEFDKLFKAVDNVASPQEGLAHLRKLAIFYCQKLGKAGFPGCVKDVLGSNPEERINNMLPSEIKTAIANIRNNIQAQLNENSNRDNTPQISTYNFISVDEYNSDSFGMKKAVYCGSADATAVTKRHGLHEAVVNARAQLNVILDTIFNTLSKNFDKTVLEQARAAAYTRFNNVLTTISSDSEDQDSDYCVEGLYNEFTQVEDGGLIVEYQANDYKDWSEILSTSAIKVNADVASGVRYELVFNSEIIIDSMIEAYNTIMASQTLKGDGIEKYGDVKDPTQIPDKYDDCGDLGFFIRNNDGDKIEPDRYYSTGNCATFESAKTAAEKVLNGLLENIAKYFRGVGYSKNQCMEAMEAAKSYFTYILNSVTSTTDGWYEVEGTDYTYSVTGKIDDRNYGDLFTFGYNEPATTDASGNVNNGKFDFCWNGDLVMKKFAEFFNACKPGADGKVKELNKGNPLHLNGNTFSYQTAGLPLEQSLIAFDVKSLTTSSISQITTNVDKIKNKLVKELGYNSSFVNQACEYGKKQMTAFVTAMVDDYNKNLNEYKNSNGAVTIDAKGYKNDGTEVNAQRNYQYASGSGTGTGSADSMDAINNNYWGGVYHYESTNVLPKTSYHAVISNQTLVYLIRTCLMQLLGYSE